MSSCNVLPTLTTTDEVTVTSVSTITSTIVTTLAPTTTTITIVIGPITETSTSVIPGQTSTTVFTTTSTTLITSAQVTTLFGTTCLPGSTPPPTPTPTLTPTPTPSPPTVGTSLSTQPDGSVVTLSTVVETVTAPPSPSQTSGGGDGGRGDANLAAIVGGSVGGGIGVIVILLLLWFFLRLRRRRAVWDGVFNDDPGTKENSGRTPNIELLESDVIPQPYPYHSSPTSPSSTNPATPYRDGLADPNYLGRNPNLAPSSSTTDYLGYYHPGYGPQQPQLYPPPPQQPYGGLGQDGTAMPPFSFPGPYAQHHHPRNDSIGRASGQRYPYNPDPSFPNPYEGFVPPVGPQDGGHAQSNSNSGSTTSVVAGAASVGSGPASRRDVKTPAGPGSSSPYPGLPVIHLDGAMYQEQTTPVVPGAGEELGASSGGGGQGEEGNRTGGTAPGPPAYTES